MKKELNLNQLEKTLKKESNKKQSKILQRFFKTGPGEYGEGDIFLSIKVPIQRQISKQFENLNLKQLQILLNSKIHEKRLIALFILIKQYQKAEKLKNNKIKQEIFNFYLKNTKKVNNWDLVDLSAPNIIGKYLFHNKNKTPRKILYKLVKSQNLWQRRISILATFEFIKNHEFKDSLKIAKLLLNDKHDLIHKAVGWMLREIGKKNIKILENFLKTKYKTMPRTMLRYSIEKFPEKQRQKYLKNQI